MKIAENRERAGSDEKRGSSALTACAADEKTAAENNTRHVKRHMCGCVSLL